MKHWLRRNSPQTLSSEKNCNSTEGKHANAQYSGRVIDLSTVRRNFERL